MASLLSGWILGGREMESSLEGLDRKSSNKGVEAQTPRPPLGPRRRCRRLSAGLAGGTLPHLMRWRLQKKGGVLWRPLFSRQRGGGRTMRGKERATTGIQAFIRAPLSIRYRIGPMNTEPISILLLLNLVWILRRRHLLPRWLQPALVEDAPIVRPGATLPAQHVHIQRSLAGPDELDEVQRKVGGIIF